MYFIFVNGCGDVPCLGCVGSLGTLAGERMKRRQIHKCIHTQEGRGLEGCVHADNVAPNGVLWAARGGGVEPSQAVNTQKKKLQLLFVHVDQSFASAWTWTERLGLSEPDPYKERLSQHLVSP